MQLSVVHQRILLLLKFLLEQTDEAHYVSVADILRFWEAHGIHGNRKNVYSDIQLLMDSGVDVICIRNMQNRYFIGSRLLELPELKLLVDAVESSHLITEKKSAALIEKLGHLTSRHNAALLNRPREKERRPHREVGPSHQPAQCRASEPPRLHGRHRQAGQ